MVNAILCNTIKGKVKICHILHVKYHNNKAWTCFMGGFPWPTNQRLCPWTPQKSPPPYLWTHTNVLAILRLQPSIKVSCLRQFCRIVLIRSFDILFSSSWQIFVYFSSVSTLSSLKHQIWVFCCHRYYAC